ncbi:hypothetical protein AAZX31_07G158000 [Glycine max]|uniref:Uncharacterized protein n=2 Tax=Glycine subgen. Soja TaxID=1462606 RepID=K7L294_SOYBN|nr:hypothetical protein JHK87_018794 [Glycine soja]KAG5023008.1 hypothetical protein JHK85_019350 [Glycine max]KAG5038089.1 hypothetical protein JHK86_018929 [Glycine max]KAG5143215.1 hypothetical protein JHK82_018910 [Glycine max]KAH1087236.1 hypothetical protein GYH30_018680 [Glycine max]
MSMKSFKLALFFVILAIEACYGDSLSNEQLTKDQVITIVPCQTKQDCIRNIRFMKCGPSVVFCYEGYCACKHLNKESGHSFSEDPMTKTGMDRST